MSFHMLWTKLANRAETSNAKQEKLNKIQRDLGLWSQSLAQTSSPNRCAACQKQRNGLQGFAHAHLISEDPSSGCLICFPFQHPSQA